MCGTERVFSVDHLQPHHADSTTKLEQPVATNALHDGSPLSELPPSEEVHTANVPSSTENPNLATPQPPLVDSVSATSGTADTVLQPNPVLLPALLMTSSTSKAEKALLRRSTHLRKQPN